MSVIIKEVVKEVPEHFVPNTLYKSTEYAKNGNIYLIIGPGDSPRHVAAVRLAGSDAPRYSEDIIKACLVPFDGEVVIKND
ncbi:hypothetical protein uav_135 [Pseudomonas phage UAVern]|uniref:Uncharacterized protein n=1 Tax=Pseudomonas phage UAVern TaxID=2856997 RepID=A0A975UV08_9CAUD|nr:hypothetical protein uav_135 [Pseudomonas phage UAVern]